MRFIESNIKSQYRDAHTFLKRMMSEIEFISYEVAGIEPEIKFVYPGVKFPDTPRVEVLSLQFQGPYSKSEVGEILRRTNQKFARNDDGSTLGVQKSPNDEKDGPWAIFLLELCPDSKVYQKKRSGRKKNV